MLVEKRYFKWNNDYNLPNIKLGDNIEVLINNGIVSSYIENNSIEYRLTNDKDVWIGVKENIVEYVYFTKEKGNALLKINPDLYDYPETEPITNYLSKHFQIILTVDSEEELKEPGSGDYLIIYFRDYRPTNMFIRRY